MGVTSPLTVDNAARANTRLRPCKRSTSRALYVPQPALEQVLASAAVAVPGFAQVRPTTEPTESVPSGCQRAQSRSNEHPCRKTEASADPSRRRKDFFRPKKETSGSVIFIRQCP